MEKNHLTLFWNPHTGETYNQPTTIGNVTFVKSPIQQNNDPELRKKREEEFRTTENHLTLFWNPHTDETYNQPKTVGNVTFVKSPIQQNNDPELRKKYRRTRKNKK